MNRYTEMQVFVRAARRRQLSAAAWNLAITPSAVSKLIARMEERLGALLFRRAHRNIVMTPEERSSIGRRLRSHRRPSRPLTRRSSAAPVAKPCAFARCRSSDRGHPRQEAPGVLPAASRPSGRTSACGSIPGRYSTRERALRFVLATSMTPRSWPRDLRVTAMDHSVRRRAIWPEHGTAVTSQRCWRTTPVSIFIRPLPPVLDCSRCRWLRPLPLAVKSRVRSNQASILIEFARAGLGIVRLVEVQIADDLAQGRLVELSFRNISARRNIPSMRCIRAADW